MVKDSLTKVDDANKPHRKDGEPSTVLSFVQRYEDPGAMPTRWQAQLEPPGMIGWWFTDADDDGAAQERAAAAAAERHARDRTAV